MNKLTSGLLSAALAVSFAASSMVPMQAAPLYVPGNSTAPVNAQPGSAVTGGVQDVAWRGKYRPNRNQVRHGYRGGSRHGGYWRGHRGYSSYRPGYRRHGNLWFPLAAFATGAVIGGALSNQSGGNSHVQYCYNRYRSYRASDNTFQPYNGPRQQCR